MVNINCTNTDIAGIIQVELFSAGFNAGSRTYLAGDLYLMVPHIVISISLEIWLGSDGVMNV